MAVAGLLVTQLGCRKQRRIGMVLRLECVGTDVEVNYVGPEGQASLHSERHTHISKKTTAEESYFPGDVPDIPKRMEVRWLWNMKSIVDHPEMKTYEESAAQARAASAVFDLDAMIPQNIKHDLNTFPGGMLKLIFVFNDDKVDLKFEAAYV